ncbi:YdiU family protein [Candidatus Pseudothioglobus singularis]|nr:YdiU family protein [Candidatus Pseudothioglobus singularis]MDB4846972.1 YdiU family protein [Candidatus Pseudothioglobus singularis]
MKNSLKFKDLGADFFAQIQTQRLENPSLIHVNQSLKQALNLNITDQEFLEICSGDKQLGQERPVSTVYAGHQFGYFVPQLGDGRSCLIGELEGNELSLKGAGTSPFSRGADGRAVLRSSIREYLCSIAMQGLNIPTTKALAIVTSSSEVYREHLEPAAIVTRVAESHIRFGHFEYFSSLGQNENVKKLANFVIKHYMPNVKQGDYLGMLREVTQSTAVMIARWQAQGFSHGVMNTDNMSILGLTIDYGPFSFMEAYDPGFICNHSDTQGRYSFERQPSVALWNLHRLADTLKTLIGEEQLKEALSIYEKILVKEYSLLMRNKFGFAVQDESDNAIINNFLELLYTNKKDYHQSIRLLSNDDHSSLGKAFYPWFKDYHKRLKMETEDPNQRRALMNEVNPKYILRNYLAEVAIRRAEDHNEYAEIDSLFKLLRAPFEEHEGYESYDSETPEWAQNLELSCSS